MAPRFGTDGVRGEAFTVLSESYVRALGAAAVRTFHTDRVLVGRDTRESGPALQRAFAEGCTAAGAAVSDLGVVPTPAVAHLSRLDDVPAAMLSASHNPWSDNGVKLFSAGGLKLADAAQHEIEQRLHSDEPPAAAAPEITDRPVSPYLDAVVAALDGRDLAGARVVLDCAHGAASTTAGEIFRRLGATTVVLAAEPDGRNINAGVGSTHPEFLIAAVREHGADAGFAFDGDADRVIACGRDGGVIDGDRILAMGAIDRRERGLLPDDTVVTTVMANLGFRRAMQDAGINVVETAVGDRHVLEALDAGGWLLGGEQSGHVIHRDLATTGDGVLTAVQLLDAAVRRGVDLGSWAAEVMVGYPQVLVNVRLPEMPADLEATLAPAVAAEEEALGDSGRVLVRRSGTEPLVRVMVEAADEATATAVAERLADIVRP